MRILLLASALLLSACSASSGATGQPPGPDETRHYDVGSFHAVALGGSETVIVRVGGPPSVRAEGSARLLDRLEVKVADGTLRIGHKPSLGWTFGPTGHVTVYVTAPSLTEASLGGSGDMRIDRVAGGTFTGSLAGSGTMEIGALKVDRADFSNAGSGDIKAAGSAFTVKLSLLGSGGIDLGGVDSRSADVSLAGSGDASVRATQAAKVSVMGSGDVRVRGGGKCSVLKVGSGDVDCRA